VRRGAESQRSRAYSDYELAELFQFNRGFNSSGAVGHPARVPAGMNRSTWGPAGGDLPLMTWPR
jgi:hypothetical protein